MLKSGKRGEFTSIQINFSTPGWYICLPGTTTAFRFADNDYQSVSDALTYAEDIYRPSKSQSFNPPYMEFLAKKPEKLHVTAEL